jgi:germacradienol/geosmin synthase
MLDADVWELGNHLQNRVPDPVDYIEMRRATFGSDLTMTLSRLTHGRRVPPAVYASEAMLALESAAANYACFMNDVFSYRKEIEFEGEFHNLILVVRNFLNCDFAAALHIVDDLMTARMREFQRIAAEDLPLLYDDLELDDDARAATELHVAELRNWLAGILTWHQGTKRYDEEEIRRVPEPARRWHGGLTGPGTATTHIPAAMAGGRTP